MANVLTDVENSHRGKQATQNRVVGFATLNSLGVAQLEAGKAQPAGAEVLQAIARDLRESAAFCNLDLIYRLQVGLRGDILDLVQQLAVTLPLTWDRVRPECQNLLRQIADMNAAEFDQARNRFREMIDKLPAE